jgi:xanthine dehydrogenase YagR molybdenum-binding subunit
MEHSVVDGLTRRVPNANLAEDAVPVHADSPPVMDVSFVDERDPHVNPLGVSRQGVASRGALAGARIVVESPLRLAGRRVTR